MNRALYWYFAAPLVTLGSAVPALASSDATGGLTISVRVPEFCDLEANDFIADQQNARVAGEVLETCNHNRGFQILASHRPLDMGEEVDVTFGEVHAQLGQSGLSPIAFRAGARHGPVPVTISTDGLTRMLRVSFSLTAV